MPDDLLVPVISALSSDSDADDGVVYDGSCLSSSTNNGQELMFVNKDVSREPTFAPSSKPGSTSMMYGAASKAGSASMYDATLAAEKCSNFEEYGMFQNTPRAGAANRHGAKTTADKYAMSTFDNDGTSAANSTPSWDIGNTFYFRKKDETKGETRHNRQKIQSSGMMGLFSMNRLSQSMSGSMEDDEDDKSPENRLAESVENDLFAMDVGLML